MPGRSKIVVVTGIPADADNWVYRRFVDSRMPSDEITFVVYDEVASLTLTQWDALRVTSRKARRAAAAKRRRQ